MVILLILDVVMKALLLAGAMQWALSSNGSLKHSGIVFSHARAVAHIYVKNVG
jgi:hypothetical protein